MQDRIEQLVTPNEMLFYNAFLKVSTFKINFVHSLWSGLPAPLSEAA